MTKRIHTRVSGVWNYVKLVYARVAGVWTPMKYVYVKVAGVWTQVYPEDSTPVSFTSNYSYTVPAGIRRVTLQAVAGGGAGAYEGNNSTNGVAGGGGGGGYSSTVNVVPGDTISFVIGAGGGQSYYYDTSNLYGTPNSGTSGGNTTITISGATSLSVTCTGGGGGYATAVDAVGGAAGTCGAAGGLSGTAGAAAVGASQPPVAGGTGGLGNGYGNGIASSQPYGVGVVGYGSITPLIG